jgi:drug/metabolite transporter (DMT)-like permease
MPERSGNMPLRAIALAAVVHTLWGVNPVAVKIGLEAVPPLTSGFVRFAIGIICVAVWARLAGWRIWPTTGEWRLLAILSALFAVQIASMNYGFGMTSGVMSSILLATHPLWAALFAVWLIPGERLGPGQVAGLATAFFGAALVLARDTDFADLQLTDLGNFIVLTSACLLGLRLAFAGRLVRSIDPVRVTMWMMALALPVFAIAGAGLETVRWELLWWRPAAALFFQGAVIAGFGFMVNYLLMQRFNPGVVVSFGFIAPISGVLSSAWLLGETLTWIVAAGSAAVGLGLFLITRRG